MREKSRRKSNHGCRFGKGSLSTMSSRRGKIERKEREQEDTGILDGEMCACLLMWFWGCKVVAVLSSGWLQLGVGAAHVRVKRDLTIY